MQYKLKIQALSPIHIGTGEQIDPLEYLVEGQIFYKLDIEQFLSDLSDNQKKEFYSAVDSSNPVTLRKFFQQNIDKEKYLLYRSVAQPDFRDAYHNSVNSPENQLLVNLITRSSGRYRPYFPGSSIKGAIRTAIVSEMANQKKFKPRNPKFYEKDLLGYDNAKQDPFRCIKIADAYLPENSTYIDKVEIINKNKKPDNSDPSKIKMFYESCFSLLDGEDDIIAETILDIDENLPEQAIWDRKRRKKSPAVSKALTTEEIIKSCRDFYLPKIQQEHAKFYKDNRELDDSNTTLLKIKNNLKDNEFMLRLGRFSHIECTTVDNFRKPRGAAAKKGYGNSRTLCAGRMAMGWAKITIEKVR